MARRWSAVTRTLWTDARFLGLSAPEPNAQTLWLYLLTGPHQGPIPGLLRVGQGALADDLGWGHPEVGACLAELSGAGLVVFCPRPAMIWLPNALRHNPPQSPNVVRSWAAHAQELPECELRDDALLTMRDQLAGPFLDAFDEVVLKAINRKASRKALAKPSRKASPKSSAKASPRALPNQDQDQDQEELPGTYPEPARSLALQLRDAVGTHSPDYVASRVKPRNLDAWTADIDRLLRLDKANPEEVKAVIQWVHLEDHDNFWRPNILSGKKLRAQWPRLRLQAEQKGILQRSAQKTSAKDWLSEHGPWLIREGQRLEALASDISPDLVLEAAKRDGLPVPTPEVAQKAASWARAQA